MTTETPCRVRDGVRFLEPTVKKREPLQLRGVQALNGSGSTLSLSKGSLKRVQGTHLREQVRKETPTRHRGGGSLHFRLPAAFPPAVSPQM